MKEIERMSATFRQTDQHIYSQKQMYSADNEIFFWGRTRERQESSWACFWAVEI